MGDDIATFHSIAELAPAASTASEAPARLHFSKRSLKSSPKTLRLGKRIEVY